MRARTTVDAVRRLVGDGVSAHEPFDPGSLADVPAPAARFLRRALPDSVPLADTAEIAAEGSIRLGANWWRFRSTQVLRAGLGFVWQPTVRRGPLRISGADTYVDGTGTMEFRLFGVVPVMRAAGADVDRSAAGRLAAETVVWLPHAITPQAGAVWSVVDDDRARVAVPTPVGPIEVVVTVDADGRLLSTCTMRWSDAATPPSTRPFGGPITGEHTTATGVRVAGDGRVGWGWETPGWPDGEFFAFHLVDVRHR